MLRQRGQRGHKFAVFAHVCSLGHLVVICHVVNDAGGGVPLLSFDAGGGVPLVGIHVVPEFCEHLTGGAGEGGVRG